MLNKRIVKPIHLTKLYSKYMPPGGTFIEAWLYYRNGMTTTIIQIRLYDNTSYTFELNDNKCVTS